MKVMYWLMPIAMMGFTQTLNAATQSDFNRFSISAGWLHVMPQGKANPIRIQTSVNDGYKSEVGVISPDGFIGAIDPNAEIGGMNLKDTLKELIDSPFGNLIKDGDGNILGEITGEATINGLESWTQQGTGLEAEDVDTLGLMFNYYLNEHVSLNVMAGIPPKVDIKGKGQIIASMQGSATPGIDLGVGDLPLLADIPITDLSSYSKAATARAWTPAVGVQYQFGKLGIDKFRPYVGAGLMYAYFNDLKLNSGIEADLTTAGHMLQNIHDQLAGAALDGKPSSGDIRVKLDADDAIAPIFTMGFSYDFTPNWFSTASVSYAKLNNRTTIKVINQNDGRELINSSTKIDIDPLMTYVGIGYRF